MAHIFLQNGFGVFLVGRFTVLMPPLLHLPELTHRIHGTGISTFTHKSKPNVSKYSIDGAFKVQLKTWIWILRTFFGENSTIITLGGDEVEPLRLQSNEKHDMKTAERHGPRWASENSS